MADKQQTEQQEEKKAFEPFLLAKNELAKNELIFNVKQFFKMTKEIKSKLDEKGIRVSEDILTDCLTMNKRTDGEGRNFAYVFDNAEHLDEELARQLEAETKDLQSRIIRDNITSTMKQAAEVLKDDILAIRRNWDARYNNESYKKFLLFDENGEISLIPDLEEKAEQESGIWVLTEAQNEVYEAHKKAAKAITDFLNYFPKSVWPMTMQDVGNLFKFSDEGGEFEPQVINYASYIN